MVIHCYTPEGKPAVRVSYPRAKTVHVKHAKGLGPVKRLQMKKGLLACAHMMWSKLNG